MLSTDTPDSALRRDTWSSGDDNADIDPELNRLRARLMAEGDDATNAFSQAPVTAELIADCIRRLEREKIDRLEEQLRSRVDAGDPEALREFMQLHRKMHEK
jgi:ribosomal 50S subunit-associated protein YjgA (DUF615 family)